MPSLKYKDTTTGEWKKVGLGQGVSSLNGQYGDIVLTSNDVGAADNTLSNVSEIANYNSTRALMGAKSNENLLDNWYFADPIDQRGGYVTLPNVPYYSADSSLVGNTTTYHKVVGWSTNNNAIINIDGTSYYVSYEYVVRGYITTSAQYIIDRWIKSKNVNLVLNDGFITLNNPTDSSSGISFYQRLEHNGVYYGKELTFSVLTDTGIFSCTGIMPTVLPDDATSFARCPFYENTMSIAIYIYANGILAVSILTGAGATANILAAKLELGDKQTLAHQDADGKWVLNDSPPNKALELAKCQRYQSVIDYGVGMTLSVAVSDSGGNVFFPFYLPASPKANGVVSSSTTLRVHGDGTSYQNVTFDGTARVQGNITSILVKGLEPLTIYSLDSASAGKLIFDFNL